jgi:hypothetical protein
LAARNGGFIMSKANLFRFGAGLLIALSLGGCYYPYGHPGYYGGGYYGHPGYYGSGYYGHPAYGY